MYRVVTTKFVMREGQRRLQKTPGPWHPYKAWADKWHKYLLEVGHYQKVEVEKSGEKQKSF